MSKEALKGVRKTQILTLLGNRNFHEPIALQRKQDTSIVGDYATKKPF